MLNLTKFILKKNKKKKQYYERNRINILERLKKTPTTIIDTRVVIPIGVTRIHD